MPQEYSVFLPDNFLIMIVEQLYTSCLSEAAYFIASGNEAAIVDPLRDIQTYLDLAKKHNVSIKYIFETHFHADFVSGHLDLAKATGATIVYGPQTQTRLNVHIAKDGEVFNVGDLSIETVHTPGHTVESTCYLLKEANGNPYCIFTGDTLFVGDVGRPDLFSGNMTKEELAGMMYESLNTRIKPLEDHIIVYPAHGPGSACGKNLGPQTFSTIGEQKQTNYALQDQTKEAFIASVTDGLNTPPQYFPINARINKEGYNSLEEVMKQGLTPLSIADFKTKAKEGAIILDTRPAHVFTEGFVPGSVFVGLEGRFAEWLGTILPFDEPIILVTEQGKEEETIVRMARVGYDKVEGYLNGGFEGWQQAGEKIDLIIDVEADELAMDMPHDPNLVVIDVRKPSEFDAGHIKGAHNVSLATMSDPGVLVEFEEERDNYYVHCAGGYRSVIACSLMKREGVHNIRNILGGWGKLKDTEGLEKEVTAPAKAK